jgi:hypothetical protein
MGVKMDFFVIVLPVLVITIGSFLTIVLFSIAWHKEKKAKQ